MLLEEAACATKLVFDPTINEIIEESRIVANAILFSCRILRIMLFAISKSQ